MVTSLRFWLLVLPALISASPTPHENKIKRDTLPSYALQYAPYTHLYSKEQDWPSDIATHLQHVTPEVNFTPVGSATLENLNTFNSSVYLTSNDNVQNNPAWLLSVDNTPTSTGYSAAPATIILADKGNGTVDVFYFYFYSYNLGPKFASVAHFGNHVGDWEHTMVRFVNEVATNIYLSAHSGGNAYTYQALTQTNGRATTYVAVGSHANYATTGEQDYEGGGIVGDVLHDQTDSGLFWDVTLNYRGFFFDTATNTFTSAGGADIGGIEQETEGVSWLSWLGKWGDEQYPDSHFGQYCIFSECAYVSGPTGPFDKNLGRTAPCEDESDCTIKTSL